MSNLSYGIASYRFVNRGQFRSCEDISLKIRFSSYSVVVPRVKWPGLRVTQAASLLLLHAMPNAMDAIDFDMGRVLVP